MLFLESPAKNHWPKLHYFSELIYINMMCVLNGLDFHLKTEIFFFKLQIQKNVSFLSWKCDHAPHDQEKFIRKIISFKTLQLPLDILAQKSET